MSCQETEETQTTDTCRRGRYGRVVAIESMSVQQEAGVLQKGQQEEASLGG